MQTPLPDGPGPSTLPSSGEREAGALDLDNLAPGKIWRGKYAMQEALLDITYGKSFAATEIATGRAVVVRSFRVTDEGRARAWSQFSEYKGSSLIAAVEAAVAGDRRVEVTQSPQGKSLLEWSSGRKLNSGEIRWLAEKLGQVIASLHDAGVVHLNLKPTTIFVTEQNGPREIQVSGIETLTDFRSAGMISLTVDPFYAPPESAGLYQQHCGPALRAWDWWTLGRILQEMMLGTHVLARLIDRDVTRRTPELQVRAEQFLREKDLARSRPGGIELMGEIEPVFAPLFRGLLSSCRDARWTARDLQRWLKGENVRERYLLGKNEKLYVWKDEAYAVPEAATHFSELAQWAEAVDQVFDAKKPALVAFLADDGSHRQLAERIRELTTLPETPAYAQVPPALTREIVTGAALALMAHGTLRFRMRGHDVNAVLFRELLDFAKHPDGLDLVAALTLSTSVQMVTQIDAEAGRFLSDFGLLSTQVTTIAAEHKWIARDNRAETAALLRWVLADEGALQEALAGGRKSFAASRDESLNQVFQRPHPDRAEMIMLAFTLAQAVKFSYVEHAAWLAEQYQTLREKGERIAVAATWHNLAKVIRFGPHLFGPLPLMLVWWLCLGACVALSYPSRRTLALALCTVAAGYALRLVACSLSRRAVGRRLSRSPARVRNARDCDEQSLSLVKPEAGISLGGLYTAWKEINRRIGELPGEKFLPVPAPESFRFANAATAFGFLATFGIWGILGVHVFRHPPTFPVLETAWLHPVHVEPKPAISGNEKLAMKRDPGTGEIVSGEAASDVAAEDASDSSASGSAKKNKKSPDAAEKKMSWAYRAPEDSHEVRVLETDEPTPEQAKAAAETGKSETDAYKTETINNLIAVKVPTDNGVGLMLFDGKSGKVADKKVFIISYVPLARSWLEIGGKQAIYLGDAVE